MRARRFFAPSTTTDAAVRNWRGLKSTKSRLLSKEEVGSDQGRRGAPEGIRTPNLLIRSQMLYPLSYGRMAANDRREVYPLGQGRAKPPTSLGP